ncbi:SIMPL domain-containing protein [Pseudalkalibacillus berkeleyi]|uniref:SIMPL domain-containing protein n=1 Tax=Pseudalkalibacillus berkeleyi TaxID=1069813 RepID=A0ABS9H166_9BACL|nr:SIMPL domain-containing protein [Pseudalkalibacillus berkeleyi]MCF6137528.1 SIMPL domain-containing protein [Pseudalkalibacillus berkeleyi]
MNQGFIPNHTIETVGEGELFIDPDLIELTLGVITENENVELATSENAARATRVLNSLYQLNIPQNQIETINFIIQPVYDYKDGTSKLKGFKVENSFRVQLQDVELAGNVYDTAINNGANIASALTYDVSNKNKYEQSVLQMAYQNAFNKALSISQSMGVNVNLIPIRVQEMNIYNNHVMYKAELLQTAQTPIRPKKVSIRARIHAWFCYYY